jgi:hypothetical protein
MSRALMLISPTLLCWLLSGCSTPDGPSAPTASPPVGPTTSESAEPARQVALPNVPPAESGCLGTVVGQSDVPHRGLGTVRVFLTLNAGVQTDGHGCIAAVAADGKVLPSIPVDVYDTSLAFADPATDATGNTFITYNPGRYDGVLVLVPTAAGFEDIGWDDQSYGTQYDGKRAYYNAKLDGLGPDRTYAIRTSHNDCEPSCADGTTTEQVLHWTGTDYVG